MLYIADITGTQVVSLSWFLEQALTLWRTLQWTACFHLMWYVGLTLFKPQARIEIPTLLTNSSFLLTLIFQGWKCPRI